MKTLEQAYKYEPIDVFLHKHECHDTVGLTVGLTPNCAEASAV